MPWRIWSRTWRRTPIHSMTQSPANTLLTPPSRSVSTSLPPLWPPSKSCRSTARAPIFVAPRRSGPALGPSAGMPNSSPQCRCAAAGAHTESPLLSDVVAATAPAQAVGGEPPEELDGVICRGPLASAEALRLTLAAAVLLPLRLVAGMIVLLRYYFVGRV